MKRSYLIMVSVLVLSSIIYSQGKSSFQFSGGMVYFISSRPGLSGTFQYNYNINTSFNFFVSADYSVWDNMARGRYLITQPGQFKLSVDAGIC